MIINFKKANIYYNFLLKRHNKNNEFFSNLLNKKPYLIVCNIFDRHPKPTSINALNTLFNIGLKGKKLENKLLQSLDNSQLCAYYIGYFI